MTELMSLLFVGLGLGLGLLVGRLANQQTKAEKIRLEERLAATDGNQELMAAQMEAVASRVSRQNSEDFLKLAEARLGKVNAEAEKEHIIRRNEIEALLEPMSKSLEDLEKFSKFI